MKIAVVILNWNGKSHLEKFLPSVVEHSKNAEIIIADNGSSDDSISFLKNNFPQVKILEFTVNSGFAGGYNKALEKISADYFILLNSDVEVTPNWIGPVIELMEKDKSIAAAQPKIKSYTEKNKFEYAGAAGGFMDKFGYPFCRGRIFDTLETDNGQYDNEMKIFWASGACMFIRADLFRKVGGFDGSFFAHMEEIDLCWRLKNSGYRIFYCPASAVYHLGGGTLHKSNPKKTYLNFRNNLMMLFKNLPSQKIIPIILVRLFLDGIAGMKFLLTGNVPDCFAIVKAHFFVYGNIFSIIKKRKSPTTEFRSGIYKKSIVLEYFVFGKKKFSELKDF